MRRLAVVIAFAASCLPALPVLAGPDGFAFRIPPGWIDLVDPEAETAGLPPNLVQEARSGRYVIYAYDPESLTPVGANTFNVVEMKGKGAVTKSVLQEVTDGATAQARKMGFQMQFLQREVVKLGSVDVARSTSLMTGGGMTVHLLQYLIPGKSTVATLTYACQPGEFNRYRSTFEASALATTGAYQHPRGGFDFRRTLVVGALGGLVGLIVSLFNKKKKPVAVAAPAVPASRPSALWDCPTCRRRVPNRIEECRCGTPRPAL